MKAKLAWFKTSPPFTRRTAGWVALALVTTLAAAGGLVWHELVAGLPAPDTMLTRAAVGTTKILDRHGRLLYEIVDPRSGSRSRLELGDIPPYCQQATVATEDANFYTNPGVDLYAIARAALLNAQAGQVVSGGSTLTQQVARLVLMDDDERASRSLRRKLREAILAYRLNRAYNKATILAVYFNEVYYGHMAYGLEAAAQTYFGTHARDLDLAQCALLAGLPQWPAYYDPLINPDAARQRQSVVLGLMAKHGYIQAEQAELAASETLVFQSAGPLLAPHFVVYVHNQLEAKLGAEKLLASAWTVTTTLDLDLQSAAEKAITRHLADLGQHDVSNAAVVVLDPHTGEVLAMVGSANYNDASIDGAVNVALALRQPGSAMKPLLYAAAFERGWSPGDVVYDIPTTFADEFGEIFIPANYDNLYHGPVSLRRSLGNSFNLPAVIVQKQVGTATLLDLARAMGLTTLADARRYGLTLTLGGGEVRLLDLTAAYGVFATGGYQVRPCSILAVSNAAFENNRQGDTKDEDKSNNLAFFASSRLESSPPVVGNAHGFYFQLCSPITSASSERLLDARAVYMVSDVLSDNEARAEQFGLFSPLRLPFPAAAKTGTTSRWRDNWTMGYTLQRVVGVWVGNANGSPMHHLSGVDGAGPIWHDVMLAAHQQLTPLPFTEPSGLERRQVCVTNGLTPGPDCPYRRTELYLAESLARPVETEYMRRGDAIVWLAPPELRDWARTNAIPFVVSGTPSAGAITPASQATANPINLLSPTANMTLLLDPHLPPQAQQLEVAAVVRDEANTQHVEFWVDGEAWTSLEAAPYRTWWTLAPGEHRFVAVAVDRQGQRWPSRPVGILVTQN